MDGIDPQPEKGALMADAPRPHILFVEDDEETISVTSAMLERLGFSVRVETESLKALKTFSEEPERFDLAILDHHIDKLLSGLKLAERFRRIRPDFPMVLYTGRFEEFSAEQLKASGISSVLLKPATLHELASALQVRSKP